MRARSHQALIAILLFASLARTTPAAAQLMWGELEEKEARPGSKATKRVLSQFDEKAKARLLEMRKLFESNAPDPGGDKFNEQRNAFLQSWEDTLDAAVAVEDPDAKSKSTARAGKSTDFSRAIERTRKFADDFFTAAALLHALKRGAVAHTRKMDSAASEIQEVLPVLKKEMALNDRELKAFRGPMPDIKKAVLKSRIDAVEASVRNCQATAKSRIGVITDLLRADVDDHDRRYRVWQPLKEKLNAIEQVPPYYMNAMDGWEKLVLGHLAEFKSAHARLKTAGKPFVSHDLFSDLESFKAYKLDSLMEAVKVARERLK